MRRFSFGVLSVLCLSVASMWLADRSLLGQPPQTTPLAPSDKAEPIDFQKARALFERRNRGEKLTADETAYLERALAERARRGAGTPQAPREPKSTVGFKPLNEMSAQDRYRDQDGGLYGKGENDPPASHRAAAQRASAAIQPLDSQGRPDREGRIVLISMSMSNATQEFSTFKRLADEDSRKSSRTTIVDCAQGGQTMERWAIADQQVWNVALERIRLAGCTPEQVQVAWVKLANIAPQGDLEAHGRKLERDTIATLANAKKRFPNLQIAFLSSRIYGGYGRSGLNPEPYSYEGAFVARWVIQQQLAGTPEMNADPDRGAVRVPLVLWGPYLWGDGVTPRAADGLVWKLEDFANDGTHPSDSGRRKVAGLLLDFFLNDPAARPWFAR